MTATTGFIHGLAWMTGVTNGDLLAQAPGLSPFILGSDTTWEQMLAAAATEHALIAEPAMRRIGSPFVS